MKNQEWLRESARGSERTSTERSVDFYRERSVLGRLVLLGVMKRPERSNLESLKIRQAFLAIGRREPLHFLCVREPMSFLDESNQAEPMPEEHGLRNSQDRIGWST